MTPAWGEPSETEVTSLDVPSVSAAGMVYVTGIPSGPICKLAKVPLVGVRVMEMVGGKVWSGSTMITAYHAAPALPLGGGHVSAVRGVSIG